MNYFFGKVLASVRQYGKQPILWCELDNIRMPAHEYLFDYPKDVTLVSWRGGLTPKCIELTAKHGNPLIMAPGEYAYLDYPQWEGDLPEFNNWGMPMFHNQMSALRSAKFKGRSDGISDNFSNAMMRLPID